MSNTTNDDDELSWTRSRFLHPLNTTYLCGNSLGLQPIHVASYLVKELSRWERLGVEGHHVGPNPWISIDDSCIASMGRLVGGREHEVVIMNSLTVNLHLMLTSFYRPRGKGIIFIEHGAFPSDVYAVRSHVESRGLDSQTLVISIQPNQVLQEIDRYGKENVALVLFGGVNYYSGLVLDMKTLAKGISDRGIMFGLDLAHAIGNVPLALHDWGVDFAVWCTYKYLNSGPGGIGGAFVHERHHVPPLPLILGGWWGTRRSDRFEMNTNEFHPALGAARWQVSNPPVFQMVALRASLDVFDEIPNLSLLYAKSQRLTGLLQTLLEARVSKSVCEMLVPRAERFPDDGADHQPRYNRGCQISLCFSPSYSAKQVNELLAERGVICDLREPNVIRVSPTPLYNTEHDVTKFIDSLVQVVDEINLLRTEFLISFL